MLRYTSETRFHTCNLGPAELQIKMVQKIGRLPLLTKWLSKVVEVFFLRCRKPHTYTHTLLRISTKVFEANQFSRASLGHLVFESWRVTYNNWIGLWARLLDWTDGLDYWINISAEFVHITCCLANQSKWTGHMFVVASTMAYYTMSAVTIMVAPLNLKYKHMNTCWKVENFCMVLSGGKCGHSQFRHKCVRGLRACPVAPHSHSSPNFSGKFLAVVLPNALMHVNLNNVTHWH